MMTYVQLTRWGSYVTYAIGRRISQESKSYFLGIDTTLPTVQERMGKGMGKG